MNIKDNENMKMVVGSVPHPIINSIVGNNVSFSNSVLFELDKMKTDYTVGNSNGRLKVFTKLPEEVTTKSRQTDVETISTSYTNLSVDDIVEEQGNLTEKEYRYTIDLGAEMTNASSDVATEANFYKTLNNPLLDFVEYKYKIPLFVNKNECEFLKNGLPNDIDGVKLFGIDMEFDTVVPEALFKDIDALVDTYIHTPSLNYLHWTRVIPKALRKSALYPDYFEDIGDTRASRMTHLNGLSGRHCKYQLTAVKDKVRNKTIVHNDMIYDTMCHSNLTIHRMLSYNEWMNAMCGGVLREKIACVNPNNYRRNNSAGDIYNYTYPLPLNVTFEFDSNISSSIKSDIISGSSYVKIGDVVVRTYKGVRHFLPSGWRKLKSKGATDSNLLIADLYVDFLRAFTLKMCIPRNTPSLVVLKDDKTYYAEVYSIPTTWQNSAEKIKVVDFTDRTKNPLEWSIRPNAFVSAEYKYHIDESLNPVTDRAFINHIVELGGFNGFLLPPERRVVDYTLHEQPKYTRNGPYENVTYGIDY